MMAERKLLQNGFAPGRDFQQDVPPVFPALPLADEPLQDKPVRQLDRAVMTYVQPRRNFTDVGFDVFRQALQRQQ